MIESRFLCRLLLISRLKSITLQRLVNIKEQNLLTVPADRSFDDATIRFFTYKLSLVGNKIFYEIANEMRLGIICFPKVLKGRK